MIREKNLKLKTPEAINLRLCDLMQLEFCRKSCRQPCEEGGKRKILRIREKRQGQRRRESVGSRRFSRVVDVKGMRRTFPEL
jgi:hypothetical protein